MKYTVKDGFPYYVEVAGDSAVDMLFNQTENLHFFKSLSDAQADFQYAPGKWSIKQLLGHITDHERIMTYRILRFSRKDQTPLAGYDQDVLINGSRFHELPVSLLVEDFENVRSATKSLLKSLSAEQMQLKGKAWIFEMNVEEFFKATIGHEMHHMKVIHERYVNHPDFSSL